MTVIRETLDKISKNKYLSYAVLAFIVLYPLRFTFTGLDLWDSGYNCINYVCFGPEYMNPSLFYSTFLANAVGRLLSLLPYGDTYAGLRFYCGLVICINVLVSSVFCIRRLKMKRWAVISGELLAVSLCYSPSVVLYNHLSFLLLTIAIILIYDALTRNRTICLAAAGFVLGLNVYVRFPNITQTVLILAVIYFMRIKKERPKAMMSRILVCIAGWIAAIVPVYAVIDRIYGRGSYIEGISGLFGISEGAGDYSAASMLKTMFMAYIKGFRRLADIALFTAAAFLAVLIIRKAAGKDGGGSKGLKRYEIMTAVISGIGLIAFSAARMLMQFDFHHYITVVLTAAMFADTVMMICLLLMAGTVTDDGSRLFAALVFLQITVLSVGSNTGISPVMNNMFLMAPFMFHTLVSVLYMDEPFMDVKGVAERIFKGRAGAHAGTLLSLGKIVLFIAFAAYYIQSVMFGAGYVYEEARNGIGGHAKVNGNRVLEGIMMSEERAGWMQELSDHVKEEKLEGKDAIVYGYAPSLLYYLSLKPVIGSWPDLDSYPASLMREDMDRLKKRIDTGDSDCPVVMIDNENIDEQRENNPEKWSILDDFMTGYGYSETFSTGRFSMYTSNE